MTPAAASSALNVVPMETESNTTSTCGGWGGGGGVMCALERKDRIEEKRAAEAHMGSGVAVTDRARPRKGVATEGGGHPTRKGAPAPQGGLTVRGSGQLPLET